MLVHRAIASMLVGMTLLGTIQSAFALENGVTTVENGVIQSTMIEEVDTIVAPGIDDLSVQLNDLYKEVGRELNIDYMYVKILHIIAGGKAVYADKRPNIYAGLTVESMEEPFHIEGASQYYNAKAPWVVCPDETVESQRPSKYYLPDAAYSVTSEIVKLMNQRYYIDRGQMQSYFDALSKDVKTNIVFCEAVLEYIGSSREAIESFYTNYENILYEKERNENVLESNGDGTFQIKEKFKDILIANNISDKRDLEVLSIVLSFDSKLAASDSPDAIKKEYVVPYKLNYTSRENMMLAAMSVIGKVRYIWGGGHLSSGNIDGINPTWEEFYNTYGTEEGEAGFGRCIKPTISWCPIHGTIENENGCLLMDDVSYSVEEYIDGRKEILNTTEIETEKYANLMESAVDFEHGISNHRLDGFDCSGYASWIYNQITDKRNYDSGAAYFISAGGLKVIEYGSKMLPGDVFSWGDHIVINIGAVRNNSKAYVMVESSPNTVKFGVMYYGGVTNSDLNLAITLAREANDLIGGLPLTEKTHIYNMDTVGYITDDETGEITGRYAEIGRLNYSFLDENLVISQYNKKIKDMTAQEIIQYTLDNMPAEYITGLAEYSGEMYNISDRVTIKLDETLLLKNEEAMSAAKVSTTEVEILNTELNDTTETNDN